MRPATSQVSPAAHSKVISPPTTSTITNTRPSLRFMHELRAKRGEGRRYELAPLALARTWRRDAKHRTRAHAHHFVGDATRQEKSELVFPTRCHHNQVGALIFGAVDDLLGDTTDENPFSD